MFNSTLNALGELDDFVGATLAVHVRLQDRRDAILGFLLLALALPFALRVAAASFDALLLRQRER